MWNALLWLAIAGSPQVQAEQAWALAYSGYVFRACPGWVQRTDVIPIEALPSPRTMRTSWSENGFLTKAYRAGGRAAEAAHRRLPGFCDHPTSGHPRRAALLDRILVRDTSPPPTRPID